MEWSAAPLGSLYRLDHDLSLHKTETGIVVSNSIAFSPAGEVMYYADLDQDVIWAYDLDTATGAISNKRVFVGPGSRAGASPTAPPSMPRGYLWNARWNGWCVARFAPDGTLDRTIEMPFQQVTCPMFGGADLDVLYVTGAPREPERGRAGEAGRQAAASSPSPARTAPACRSPRFKD